MFCRVLDVEGVQASENTHQPHDVSEYHAEPVHAPEGQSPVQEVQRTEGSLLKHKNDGKGQQRYGELEDHAGPAAE